MRSTSTQAFVGRINALALDAIAHLQPDTADRALLAARRRRGDRTLSNAEQLTWLLAAIATAVSLQRAWNIVAKTTMQAPDKA